MYFSSGNQQHNESLLSSLYKELIAAIIILKKPHIYALSLRQKDKAYFQNKQHNIHKFIVNKNFQH